MSDDPTFLRAVANALWPHLRRDRWQTHTVTRDLSKYNPSGYQAGPKTSTVATAPSMNAVIELHHECFIRTVLYAEEWPGKTSHAIVLTRTNYEHAIDTADDNHIADYALAITTATCRQPFHAQANRHGVMRLRRNGMDELITVGAATVLEAIAAAANVLPITEATIDDYLITDDDIDLQALEKALGTQAMM